MKVIDVENAIEASGKVVLVCASEIEDLPAMCDKPYYNVSKTKFGFSWKGMDKPLFPGEQQVGELL
jgi:hypothetical protein